MRKRLKKRQYRKTSAYRRELFLLECIKTQELMLPLMEKISFEKIISPDLDYTVKFLKNEEVEDYIVADLNPSWMKSSITMEDLRRMADQHSPSMETIETMRDNSKGLYPHIVLREPI